MMITPRKEKQKATFPPAGSTFFESNGRLLVSKVNLAAVGLYRSLGFDFVGDCHEYGIDFFACEKVF